MSLLNLEPREKFFVRVRYGENVDMSRELDFKQGEYTVESLKKYMEDACGEPEAEVEVKFLGFVTPKLGEAQ